MISKRLNELIRPLILVQRIIWFIITLSIVFFISFIYFTVGGTITAGSGIGIRMEIFVYLLSGACAAGSIFYYRYSISDNKLKQFISRDLDVVYLAKDTRTKKVDEDILEKLNSLPEIDAKIYSLMFEYQKNITVSLISCELVIIFGSALSFTSENFFRIVPFAIVSIILCVWMFPRPQSLIRRVHNL